jgi:YtkA-like
MGRRFLLVLLLLAAFLAAAGPAGAHKGGKAEPVIAAGLREGPDLVRTLTISLTDRDSGDPVKAATVTADAVMPAFGLRAERVRLAEVRPAVYRAAIKFPAEGAWRVRIRVGGAKVLTARAALPVQIEVTPVEESPTETTPPTETEGAAGHAGGGHGEGEVTPLQTSVATEDTLAGGDYVRMAFLWVHGLAAVGWIVGVLVMVVALSTRPGVLAETARTRLAQAYQSWGALAHWSLVPLIVGTGIYNMFEVSPFELAWTPQAWSELAGVPYGYLYESILLVKLGLFGVLLVTGTMTLLRTVEVQLPVTPVSNPHPSGLRVAASALGPAGLVYLATIPLILAAAMALRYVHILNHAGSGVHG